MSRDLRTLKEVRENLITISDVFESIRKRLSQYNTDDLLAAQEHIVAAIDSLKRGITDVSQSLTRQEEPTEDVDEEIRGE